MRIIILRSTIFISRKSFILLPIFLLLYKRILNLFFITTVAYNIPQIILLNSFTAGSLTVWVVKGLNFLLFPSPWNCIFVEYFKYQNLSETLRKSKEDLSKRTVFEKHDKDRNKNSWPKISSDTLKSYGLINSETCRKPVRCREPQASRILPWMSSYRDVRHSWRASLRTRTTISHAWISNSDGALLLHLVVDHRSTLVYANFGNLECS